jgi:hypothetical protein
VTQTYQPPQPQPQPEPPKNWIQRNLGWKLFALIVILILLGSCSAILAVIGGEDEPATTAQPTPAATVATSEAPKPQEPEASQPETPKIGEKVTDSGYQFTVIKVTCGTRRIGGENAQGQFCLIKMSVKNVGKDPITFSEENQALVDTKGNQHSPDDEAWIYLEESDIWAEINPGNTLKTTVPFDIPKSAKPDHLLLMAGVFGFSEGVQVKLT